MIRRDVKLKTIVENKKNNKMVNLATTQTYHIEWETPATLCLGEQLSLYGILECQQEGNHPDLKKEKKRNIKFQRAGAETGDTLPEFLQMIIFDQYGTQSAPILLTQTDQADIWEIGGPSNNCGISCRAYKVIFSF